MAGRGLGTLTLNLAVALGGFIAGMNAAERKVKSSSSAMEKRARNLGIAIGASLSAGVTAFGYAVKNAIDQADQLNDISKKIGIPTDVLSQLQYAAKLSGVATEQLQAGLVKMIKFQAEAAAGAKANVKVFSVLGIAIKDSSGNLRDTNAVFKDFAEVFSRLKDGPEKTALALKVFGKAGAELIPLLDEGKRGIQGMADELDRLGGTVTPAVAAAADHFNDNLDALKTAAGGLALQVASDLLPGMISLTESFIESAKEGGTLSNTAHNVAQAIQFIGVAADNVVGSVQGLTSYLIAASKAGEALNAVNLAGMLANPGAALGGISTAIDQGNAAFNPRAPAPAPHATAGSRARGGKGMGFSAPDISGLFSPEAKAGAKAHAAAVDQVAEAYKRMHEQMAETITLFGQTTEVAKVRYDLEHGELAKLSAEKKDELIQQAQKIDQLNAEKDAQEHLNDLREKEERAIADHKESVKGLLDDIAFETLLIGKSNDEREKMIALRGLNGQATAAEAEQITAAMDALQKSREQNAKLTSAMDEFRGNFEDTVTDVLTGAKSISEAFKSLADSIVAQIARIIAQQLTTSLFGEPGSTGGGSAGGWLSSLFGMFTGSSSSLSGTASSGFGQGFATGGNPPVGQPYLVGEHGPELHMDRTPSTIVPNGKFGGHSITININGNATRETAQQIANEARRVLAFSGRSG